MFLVPMTRNASELARSFDRLFDDSFDRFFAPVRARRASAARRWTWPNPTVPTPSSSTCPAWPRKT